MRYSSLLRLEYMDPLLFTIPDAVHLHLLGNFENHISSTWGMDSSRPSGDGTYSPSMVPPTCAELSEPRAWNNALKKLDSRDRAGLLKSSRACLWHFCKDRNLRRAGTKEMLVAALMEWVCTSNTLCKDETSDVPYDIARFTGSDCALPSSHS